MQTTPVTLSELEQESIELLPERETLFFGGVSIFNASVLASNSAETVQALTLLSAAKAVAVQNIVISG